MSEDEITKSEEEAAATEEEAAATEGEAAATESEAAATEGEAAATEGEAAATEGEAAATESEAPIIEGELQEKLSPYVLGIDLGTSTSVVAVYRRGRAQVLDVFGQSAVASVVNYRGDSEPLVGEQAKRRALIDPDNTVASIKRHMGDPDYKREINEKPVEPEAVSALILEHIKNGAQEHKDLNGTVKYAVVTVPANFNNNQREATLKAGQLAGLEVLRLVEEPVAAAVAYGFDHDRDQTILVYDLGGGTFDVCILKIVASENGNAKFDVLGKAGIPKLGGDDFDNALMKILAQTIIDEGGPDVLDLKKDQGINKKKLRTAMQILKEKAEQAKIELSEAEVAHVDAPSLVKNENGQEFHLSTDITRETFNEIIKPLVDESAPCIQQAMDEAKIGVDDLDRIILVGNSTRAPYVRKMVTEMLGKEPYGDIDPGNAVAEGAAILGATFELPGEKPDEDTIENLDETNSTSHNLGIETLGQRFSKLLDKGAELPCENTKVYATSQNDQPELRIAVFQFPSETETIDMDIPGSACLGEFHFGPLDKAPKGQVQVEVTFEINTDGMLKVTANGKKGAEGVASKPLEVRVS